MAMPGKSCRLEWVEDKVASIRSGLAFIVKPSRYRLYFHFSMSVWMVNSSKDFATGGKRKLERYPVTMQAITPIPLKVKKFRSV